VEAGEQIANTGRLSPVYQLGPAKLFALWAQGLAPVNLPDLDAWDAEAFLTLHRAWEMHRHNPSF
jgi:hypothetical protein